jgi:thioredoxin reductase
MPFDEQPPTLRGVTMSEFDVIVIGAGPPGENAAGRAVEAGFSAAIVESRLVGRVLLLRTSQQPTVRAMWSRPRAGCRAQRGHHRHDRAAAVAHATT